MKKQKYDEDISETDQIAPGCFFILILIRGHTPNRADRLS